MPESKNRLVVASKSFGEDIPDWLLKALEADRIMETMGMTDPQGMVGEAETCAYLYTRSLVAPMNSEYCNIYVYLAGKLMKRKGVELPEDMRQPDLSEDEQREFISLRRQIFKARGGEIRTELGDILKKFRGDKNGKEIQS